MTNMVDYIPIQSSTVRILKLSAAEYWPRLRVASETGQCGIVQIGPYRSSVITDTLPTHEDISSEKPLTSPKAPVADDGDLSPSATGFFWISNFKLFGPMPSYGVPSYIWDEETSSDTIWGNGQPTPGCQSLELALQYRWKVHHSTSLWADAICINQKDEQEKINQVNMMGKVYKRAADVRDWLGPAKDDSDVAMELYEKMGKKAIEAGIQDFRGPNDSRDNEDSLAAIDSRAPYEIDIEERGKDGGNDDSLSEMTSSNLAEEFSDCLHQLRPTYIGDAIENIAGYEMVTSDGHRDDVENLGDSCGGLNQASEVIRSKFDCIIRASSSYTKVEVLLLKWTDDDQGDQNEISDLKTLLEKLNFHVEESCPASTEELQKKKLGFLDLPTSEADLLIVYYAGHGTADNPRYGRRIWRLPGWSGLGKNDIEKRGKHVLSSHGIRKSVSEDGSRFGERLNMWTRIKASWSQLQSWVDPSTTFGTRNSRETSPGWTLGYGRRRLWRERDTSPQYLSRIDRVCLGLNPIIYSPLVWILLRSLRLEPHSLLDRRLQQLIPFTSNAIIALEYHPRTALILVVHLLSLSVAVILKPAASIDGRTNLYVCPCWILVLTCGLLSWPLVGGSLLEFCLLFVPFALSVGMTLGLLIKHLSQLRLVKQLAGSRRHHLVLANDGAEKM